MENKGIFAEDLTGNLWGIESYERLEKAKWYQKVFAKLSKRYKLRFRDFTPIPLKDETNGTYTFDIPEQPVGTKINITTEK